MEWEKEGGRKKRAYGMFPDTGARDAVSTSRVPVHVGDSVVISRVHELQVCGEVLVALGLLAFKVHIPKVEVEALLRVDGGYDDEATLRRPVDGIAVLLLDGTDVFEVADARAFDLFGAEEGDGGFRGDGSGHDDFGGGDEDEAVAFGFPGEVDNGVLDRVDNFDRDALFADAEDLEIRRQ